MTAFVGGVMKIRPRKPWRRWTRLGSAAAWSRWKWLPAERAGWGLVGCGRVGGHCGNARDEHDVHLGDVDLIKVRKGKLALEARPDATVELREGHGGRRSAQAAAAAHHDGFPLVLEDDA